ncbi:hypothetical protein SEPCBS119000_003263 [Sporothrix epigloea]|uniref:C2H2-type domain-containing protein n=1 Tax=Sporothrix epigloea TaxID=1892477 RepID=A0ABP0DKW7_9PEZI
MKRAREHEEPPPSSPPLLSRSPALNTGKAVGSDGQLLPLQDTSFDAHGTQGPSFEPCAKIASLSWDGEDEVDKGREQAASAMMSCLLHQERIQFPTYDAYEAHYAKEHLNRCIECRRNFPSPRYLSLHGDEWHNPFVAVKRDRGEHTYGCFVEGCERKCGSSDKRRRHLIDKHGFPRNFFFSITQHGIDGKQSLLQDDGRQHHHRRQSSTSTVAKKDVARRRAASMNWTDAAASPPVSKPNSSDCGNDIKGDDKEGIDGANSKFDKEVEMNVQGVTIDSAQGIEETPDVEMDDIAKAISSMTLIPRSVRFGRGGRAGFAKR